MTEKTQSKNNFNVIELMDFLPEGETRSISLTLSIDSIKKLDAYVGTNKLTSRSRVVGFLLGEFFNLEPITPSDILKQVRKESRPETSA